MIKTLLAATLAALLSTGAYAQTVAPMARPLPTTTPSTAPTAPTATPPATTPRTAPAPLPAGTKVNLNTATAAQLDALPDVGKARLKVIMTERAKSPFKDWTDFDARTQHTSVNAGVKAKIKDMVTF